MKQPARLLPSTGVSLLLLAGVILFAAHWGAGSRLPHTGLIPGLTYELQRPANGTPGLIVTSVEDQGPASAAGISVGDMIERIDGRPVTALADVAAAKKQGDAGGMQLVVRHAGTDRYMRLPAAGR